MLEEDRFLAEAEAEVEKAGVLQVEEEGQHAQESSGAWFRTV